MTGQFVRFTIERDSAEFHCPACGAQVLESDGTLTGPPCRHLLFVWLDDAGHFAMVARRIRAAVERAEAAGASAAPWDEAFLASCPKGTVLFSLTWNETPKGAASPVAVVAVDFGHRGSGHQKERSDLTPPRRQR
jgi:hypothetical protein